MPSGSKTIIWPQRQGWCSFSALQTRRRFEEKGIILVRCLCMLLCAASGVIVSRPIGTEVHPLENVLSVQLYAASVK